MIEPTNTDIGRKVVYRAAPDIAPEEGVITSINDRGVFVRYGHTGTSQLTRREDLEWMVERDRIQL